MALFSLQQWSNTELFLKFDPRLPGNRVNYDNVIEFCKGFKEKKWKSNDYDGKGFVIPLTDLSIKHITAHWRAGVDYTMDEGAKMMMAYLKLTVKSENDSASKRWDYVFDGKDTDYTYPAVRKPFAHQRLAVECMYRSEAFALLMEMGTGKSKCVVDELDIYARELQHGEMIRAIIVCPKSLRENWRREFAMNVADCHHYDVGIIDNSLKAMDVMLELVQQPSRFKILIISYDSVRNLLDELMLFAPNYIAMDESHYVKNPDSKRFKGLIKLTAMPSVLMKRILTGTPVSNNILDLWSQFQLIRPGCLGYNGFSGFRTQFCNIRKITTETGQEFDKIEGFKDVDELREAIGRVSLIVKKERCLDLPEKLYETRRIEMPPELREKYDNFEMNFSLMLEEGVAAKTEFIIVQMLKLSQMCCGFISADDVRSEEAVKVVRKLEGGDAKLKEMMDDVEDVITTSKLIIWARFHYDIDSIVAECNQRGIGALSLDGRTKDRQVVVDRFNNDPTIRVFVGHVAAGGVGLTLLGDQKNDKDACKVTFFYSNGFSFGQRDQAEARNHRIGQRNCVLYRDYVYENTIEETIAAALQSKKDLAESMKDQQSIKHLLRRNT